MTDVIFDPPAIEGILEQLVDENVLACRALLSVTQVEFTDTVQTASVTLGRHSVLRINPVFIRTHCRTEDHVKAVLLHEFLHILLRHTMEFTVISMSMNIAMDSVINAILHRKLGDAYSSFMTEYYSAACGPLLLLRPIRKEDYSGFWNAPPHGRDLPPGQLRLRQSLLWLGQEGLRIWESIYQGYAQFEDVLEWLKSRRETAPETAISDQRPWFLGDHSPGAGDSHGTISGDILQRIHRSLRELNVGGHYPGVGSRTRHGINRERSDERWRKWQKMTFALLRRLIHPDRYRPRKQIQSTTVLLPVLNSGDRRGIVQSLWNPLLVERVWTESVRRPVGSVWIYVDVSGSMANELSEVVALLYHFRDYLRRPFFCFSTKVEIAEFRRGKLVTNTTGGTSLRPVLNHLREHRPAKALLLTDGFVDGLLHEEYRLTGTKVEVLLTSRGTDLVLKYAGWPLHRLDALP